MPICHRWRSGGLLQLVLLLPALFTAADSCAQLCMWMGGSGSWGGWKVSSDNDIICICDFLAGFCVLVACKTPCEPHTYFQSLPTHTCSYGGQFGFSPTLLFYNLKPVSLRTENGTLVVDDAGMTSTLPNPRWVADRS